MVHPWTFTVDGKPFFPLGGQAHNSSAYSGNDILRAFQAVEAIGGNTLEVPIYWEQFEAVEGEFDYSMLEILLKMARDRGVRLVLLWFATWKNGTMKYVPAWVKRDRKTYRRVVGPYGVELAGLDPTCEANLEADRRALTALVRRLRELDETEQTVIALQVENEPGIMGSDRDYSERAERLFQSALPAELSEILGSMGPWPERPAPAKEVGKETTWSEAFPLYPGEAFTAWHIAVFIGKLAAAVKQVYPGLVLYANAWLQEHGFQVPGLNYPSGGPTRNVLDLWKLAAPDLDLLAPDIYIREDEGFHSAASAYAREDNPLFVPESGRAEATSIHVLHAIGNLGAVGYGVFGIEDVLDEDGSIQEDSRATADTFRFLREALPLVLKYRGQRRVHALLGRPYRYDQVIPLTGEWSAVARYPESKGLPVDHDRRKPVVGPGRGLLIQASDTEFYVVGANLNVLLKRRGSVASLFHSNSAQDEFGQRTINFVTVEEGKFNDEGKWVVSRRRNGDESDNGIWTHPDAGVIRVVVGD